MTGDSPSYRSPTGRCTFSTGLTGEDSTGGSGVVVLGVAKRQSHRAIRTCNRPLSASATETAPYMRSGRRGPARRSNLPLEPAHGVHRKPFSQLTPDRTLAGPLATTLSMRNGTSYTTATRRTRSGSTQDSLEAGVARPSFTPQPELAPTR